MVGWCSMGTFNDPCFNSCLLSWIPVMIHCIGMWAAFAKAGRKLGEDQTDRHRRESFAKVDNWPILNTDISYLYIYMYHRLFWSYKLPKYSESSTSSHRERICEFAPCEFRKLQQNTLSLLNTSHVSRTQLLVGRQDWAWTVGILRPLVLQMAT
jgi:hypothetical protein